MDAVQAILQHMDVNKILTHYDFDKVKNDGNYIRACCKIHGGDNPTAFVMNKDTSLWYCHTGECGGGDIFTLVQKMEGIEFPQAVQWLADFYGINISNLRITERKAKYIQELKSFIQLMRKRKKKQFEPFTINAEIKSVAKYRNFNTDTITHFLMGYVEQVQLTKRDGTPFTLTHRLVFPIVFNNIQVGISFRRIKSSDVPKWMHQPVNLEIGSILYNYDNAKNSPIIVICEGITDVWAFHEIGVQAVATFGAHITEEQYKLLLRTGADLVLAFDGDEAGQLANKIGIKWFKNKANLSIINFNPKEDPENISREELKKRYECRKKL